MTGDPPCAFSGHYLNTNGWTDNSTTHTHTVSYPPNKNYDVLKYNDPIIWTTTSTSANDLNKLEEILKKEKENVVEANACICDKCGKTIKVEEANKLDIIKRVVLKKIDDKLVDAEGKPSEEEVKKTDKVSKTLCVDCLAKIEELL